MAVVADSHQSSNVPALDIDPFSEEFLSEPYDFHERMRESAPVFWLSKYNIYGMARHAEVHASLSNWQTFSSARGVGIEDFAKEKPWRPPSRLLEKDPPEHGVSRTVMARILSPGAMRKLKDGFQVRADKLIDDLLKKREIDGVKDLAEIFPLYVFPDAVGIPMEGRENLLPFGNMVFNSFGPRNKIFEESVKDAAPVVEWIYAQCHRHMLTPDGFGSQVWAAYDAGEIDEDLAHTLVRSMLTAGLDTTVNGLANSLYAFATNPEQWTIVRQNPALYRPAFDEVLRWESPVQTFFRTTTQPVEVAGVTLPADQKVLLFLGAANRDYRRFEKPAVFDAQRKATGHVALGTGIHGCVGQLVARLEAEVVFTALARKVATIKLIGAPKRKLNNTLRALDSLPIELVPAA